MGSLALGGGSVLVVLSRFAPDVSCRVSTRLPADSKDGGMTVKKERKSAASLKKENSLSNLNESLHLVTRSWNEFIHCLCLSNYP